MSAFRIQLLFPVDGPVCAEILNDPDIVASVYEQHDGWKIDLYQARPGLDLDELQRVLASAKERLGEYPNRRGEGPPDGLTAAGFALWLTEKADGTMLADRSKSNSSAASDTEHDRQSNPAPAEE